MRLENTTGNLAIKVSIYSIIINILLSVGKLIAGIVGNSTAMISDAIHSVSDVFSTLIVMAGVKISCKASDDAHPYGHERLECVAAVVLALLLALTGLGIGYQAANKIFNLHEHSFAIPTIVPLIAAVVSIISKEIMYRYTKSAAISIKSDALMADAWHHRSDALSSIGSFVGIFGARMGYPILDPLAGIVICIMIVYAAFGIFRDAVDKMVDKACDETTIKEMTAIIEKEAGVAHIDSLNTRVFASRIYVDVEVSAADDLTLVESHKIAENIHHAIASNFPDVKHCMVHINPESEIEHH